VYCSNDKVSLIKSDGNFIKAKFQVPC